jgi:hypothetical protein
MASRYRVTVFGKSGCDKCKVLNQRIDQLLEKEEWSDFEKQYMSLDTEDGLVVFCKTECINPQRIPALVVSRWDEDKQDYVYIPDARRSEAAEKHAHARLYSRLGIQTDYSEKGRGVISPGMIKAVLQDAAG